ncbi:MAG: triple tyrosine motif-containing protein [Bacteroidota bacterium]|nr:triple tyrosine motif-containing protein [Bacteroidota bacterium]
MNFSKKDFCADNQTWAVAQDAKGMLYFGNNRGLLRFDGFQWDLFRIPGNRVVRSIYASEDGKIFVGAFEEFGFFEPDGNGHLVYNSLSDRLKGHNIGNDEIWSIVRLGKTIYFQAFTSLYTYDGSRVRCYRPSQTFLLLNKIKQQIYTHVEQVGFCRFDQRKGKFSLVIPLSELKSKVVSALPYDSKRMLLVTAANGLFLYNGETCSRFECEANDLLAKANANRAVLTKDSVFVVGTIQDGAVAFDKKGSLLWHVNKSTLLQSNTVLGMYCDRENNVWLALEKGISVLRTGSSLRHVSLFTPSVGAVYAAVNQGQHIYVGTNQGLYSGTLHFEGNSRKTIDLSLAPQAKGQVWELSKFDNQVFCGTNEGTYSIDDIGRFTQVSSVNGGFCLKKGIINGREVLVQGTYSLLCIYTRDKGGVWRFSHVVSDFINPVRFLEIDYKGIIWASHLHKGLYRIELSDDLRRIHSVKCFDSLDGKDKSTINVFKLRNRVVFTSGNGFYTYDDLHNRIIPYDELNRRIGSFASSYRICPFSEKYSWFIRRDNAALVCVSDDKASLADVINYSDLPNESLSEYMNIIPLSQNYSLICLEDGLALYSHSQKKINTLSHNSFFLKYITAISASDDQLPLPTDEQQVKIPNDFNSLRFNVAYPQYNRLGAVLFRFYLHGYDKKWTEPGVNNVREYMKLPFGKYSLRVAAFTITGQKLAELRYDFSVKPPFYFTWWAIMFYLLVFAGITVLSVRRIMLLYHRKKVKVHLEQIARHKKELEESEKQIIRLEKEKLESDLIRKSKELASSTMSIIKKNEILGQIKEELKRQKEMLGSQYPNKYYEKVVRLIDENLSSEDDWAVFQSNFDRIHENFFRNLRARYPDLTSTDLRFCAYLRLNMASKDIANLMNISLKGVEAGRYRLRKKLDIPSEISLVDFMIDFK